jgi:HAD superfamily hydrolase (TIGR01509 family)
MRPKAIVFDLDGVLWNSNLIHEAAFVEVLKKMSNQVNGFIYSEHAGMKTIDVFRKLFPDASPDSLNSMCKEKQMLVSKRLANSDDIINSQLNDVLLSLIGKYELGICTSSRRENLQIFLEKSKSAHFFSFMITSEEVANAKPDPEIYLRITREFKLHASEIMVVEDSIQGIISAKLAGNRVTHLCEANCKINHQDAIFADIFFIKTLNSLTRLLDLV